MKVCIFGGSGFIGSSITDMLSHFDIDWVGISREKQSNKRFVKAELTETKKLSEVISDYPIVINAMGSFKPKDFEINTKIVFQTFWDNLQQFNILMDSSNVKSLIHISSGGTVYGEYNDRPHEETSLLKPISWYGKAKAIEESLLEKQALQKGFIYKCARVGNPFGNNKFTTHGFVDVLLHTIKSGGVFHTFKHDEFYRDFIFAPDMAEIIINILLLDTKENINVFNVGSGVGSSLLKLVNYAQSHVANFSFRQDYLKNDYDVHKSVLNINKIKEFKLIKKELTSVEDYISRKLMDIKLK